LGKYEKIIGNLALKFYKGFVIEREIYPLTIEKEKIRSILIILRHQMGDMLCALPMMRSLRSYFRGAHIILVTKRSTCFREIFEGNDSPADEVYEFENGFEKYLDLVKILRTKNIDLAIVPSTVVFSATNHFFAYNSYSKYRTGVRSKDFEENRVGYLLNIKNDFLWDSKKVHQIERNLDIIRQLNIPAAETSIRLTVNSEQKSFAEVFYKENFPDSSRPVIGFHPGAGKEQNVWPAEKFAELAKLLFDEKNAYFFISEGPADGNYVSKLKEILKSKYPEIPFVCHKGKLMNNAAIIAKLKLFVTNDTGIMHICAGFNVPLAALFGPTPAYEWGPVGSRKVALQGAKSSINNIDTLQVKETCMMLLSV
jgi:ADP-heptose:LPS heptosyltransferase